VCGDSGHASKRDSQAAERRRQGGLRHGDEEVWKKDRFT
jgi:hypothetical protein